MVIIIRPPSRPRIIYPPPLTLFLASAVSLSPLADAPAWPNCTSVENILAQVPIHHATVGLNRRPDLIASHRAYSSIPPTCMEKRDRAVYIVIARAHKRERERVTYASATVRAESKTTTINRTILEIAHCCMCMECSPMWPSFYL